MMNDRYVGTFSFVDGKLIDVNKVKVGEGSILSGRYNIISKDIDIDPADPLSSTSGSVRYNGITHSAIVIMPVKIIELAKLLKEEFNLSPVEDDFVTWEEISKISSCKVG